MKVRTVAAVVAAGVSLGMVTAGPADAAPKVHQRIASPHAPVHDRSGKYVLVTDIPMSHDKYGWFVYEDQTGWNCFVDGNGHCSKHGLFWPRGFSRKGWRLKDGRMVACIAYRDEPEYVMCNDGSVYVPKGSDYLLPYGFDF